MANQPVDIFSIIPSDKIIVKNGKALTVLFQVADSKIRAIQWKGTHGFIEMKQGASQYFDNKEMITELIALYDVAEAEALAAEIAAAEAAAAESAA